MQQFLQSIGDFVQSDWFYTVAAFIIIMVATGVISWLLSKFLKKIFNSENTLVPTGTIFINIARGAVWITGICIMLTTCFDINVSAVVTALGVGGIAISLGFQDTISNLIGGLQVSLTKIIQPGDYIKIGSDSGRVEDIAWRHTTIRTYDGNHIIIPNSVINKTALIRLPQTIFVKVPFVLDRGITDLESFKRTIVEQSKIALKDKMSLPKDPIVSFTELSEEGINGAVTVYVPHVSDRSIARQYVLEVLAVQNSK